MEQRLLEPEALARLVTLLPAGTAAAAGGDGEQLQALLAPMLRLLQWVRLARVESVDDQWAFPDFSGLDMLGQAPLRAPSVFNFFRPGYVPAGTELARRGLVAPEFQITNESTVMGYANFLLRVLPHGLHDDSCSDPRLYNLIPQTIRKVWVTAKGRRKWSCQVILSTCGTVSRMRFYLNRSHFGLRILGW